MIVGEVTQDAKPLIEINVYGPLGNVLRVAAIIDTGFDGHLILPTAVISTLQLSLEYDTTTTLATELKTRLNVFSSFVDWHGQLEQIDVLEAEGQPLIGMQLLGGSRLVVDAIPGGRVEISPLA